MSYNVWLYGYANPVKYIDQGGRKPIPVNCQGIPDCGIGDEPGDPLDLYFNNLDFPDVQWPVNMRLSRAGADFIKTWESIEYRLNNDGNSYSDPLRYNVEGRGTGNCSIGWGHLVHMNPCNSCNYPSEAPYINGINLQDADALFDRDVSFVEPYVRNYVSVRLTQFQYDALVSLIYNWGGDRFIRSVKRTLLNQGFYVATADSIREGPITSNGIEMPGLVRRRTAEAAMFLTQLPQWDRDGNRR
jgi:GH24 family phage-related lysozyme (muramidase)